jgi:hypothetical protein
MDLLKNLWEVMKGTPRSMDENVLPMSEESSDAIPNRL